MKDLRVLYTQGNPFRKKVKHYKKKLTVAMPGIAYLDDRPVFHYDRRYAEAFMRGGYPAEREERKKYK